MLFRNFGAAVRISAAPVLIGYLLGWFLWEQSNVHLGMLFFAGVFQFFPWPLFWAAVKLMAVAFAVFCWIAVVWHRFVLLEELPALMPRFPVWAIMRYAVWSLFLFLAILLASAAIGIVLGLTGILAVAVRLSAAIPGLSIVLFFLATGLATAMWYRLGLVLPATALGTRVPGTDSWSWTGQIRGPIFGAAMIMAILPTAANLTLQALSGGEWAKAILGYGTSWLFMMAGISILTTLYGHLVEGRDLI